MAAAPLEAKGWHYSLNEGVARILGFIARLQLRYNVSARASLRIPQLPQKQTKQGDVE